MCGIAGYLSLDGSPVEPSVLERMAATLRHRGPDGEGILPLGEVGLAHRRLAIIDLAGGAQPMASGDGTLWITFNGEIYNYRELRADFERRGYRFQTNSDTETILAAYEERGPDCVELLRGMFAFALWDARQRRLLLARDRFGIKPLYYGVTRTALVFASELKALLAHPDVERTIDPIAASDYLTYLYVPGPRSILQGISKLAPGTTLTWERGAATERTYWEPSFDAAPETLSEDEWCARLTDTIGESVALHMRSDVPYGALLSGGLDSATIVALMAEHSSRPIRTYTVGFEEADFDERAYARAVAERYGTQHTELCVTPTDAAALPAIVREFDEPFADPSALPCFHLARAVAADVKVCLSGDGGDEAFGGYDAYRLALAFARLDRVPLAARRALLDPLLALYPSWLPGRGMLRFARLGFADRYVEIMAGFDDPAKRRVLTDGFADLVRSRDSYAIGRAALAREADALSRMQESDYRTYLPDDILVKVDRTAMLHSLEVRVPFIDHVVFDLARRIPPTLRVVDGRGKHVLRRAMGDRLPPANLGRRKQGFGVPLQRWLGADLGAFATDVLADRRTRERGILRVPELLKMIRLNRHARPRLTHQLWGALMFELWCREYLDAETTGIGSRPPAAPSPRAMQG